MLEMISNLPDDVIGVTARGKVTGWDYETILIPAVEEKFKKHSKVSFLYHLGRDFSGFDWEAMWDDTKIGLRHLTSWKRIAVVTDTEWVRTVVGLFRFMIPAEVKVFPDAQLAQAREWVSGAIAVP